MFSYVFPFIVLLSTALGFPAATKDPRCLNHCSNDGVCVIVENSPQCYCLPEWEGETCDYVREQTDINEEQQDIVIMSRSNLRNSPCSLVTGLCKNSGLCQFADNKYSCACTDEFTGKRCELQSPCIGYCKNNGICILINNGTDPSCNCNGTAFNGVICTNPLPSTTTTTTTTTLGTPDPACAPLLEFCGGFGCRIVSGRPECNCPPNTVGPFCDPVAPNPSGQSTSTGPTNPAGQSTSTGPTNPPGQSTSTGPTNPAGQSTSTGPTNPAGQSTTSGSSVVTGTPQPNKTCANNPCRNTRPCYNTGNTYFCYCGSLYTGYDCEITRA